MIASGRSDRKVQHQLGHANPAVARLVVVSQFETETLPIFPVLQKIRCE